MATTREIILGYLRYRLERAGCKNVEAHASPIICKLFKHTGTKISSLPANIIIQIGKNIDQELFNKVFMDRMISAISLDHSKVRFEYFGYLNNLFNDKKITWGRLALVVVYTVRLCEKAMDECRFEKVHNIVDWCCFYFKYNRFEDWINTSGGWENLPVIYKEKACGPFRKLFRNLPDPIMFGFKLLAVTSATALGLAMCRAAAVRSI